MGGIAGRIAAVALLVLVASGAPPAHAADGFRVGAARVDTTPPPFDPAHDVQDLGAQAAACPAALWSGKRVFRFEEPYQDGDGNGQFDYPEPYCDLNGNGRWDGIWESGGPGNQARGVREDDRPSARAMAVSDGGRAIVIVSVSAEGIFENYVAKIRDAVVAGTNGKVQGDDVIVSADHNESTPDTVGINGAPDLPDPFSIGSGLRSGIDEFYMERWLVPQVAKAAVGAVAAMRPATLYARNFPVPDGLVVDLSNNWPTTDGVPGKDANSQAAAIDPKVRVLQARDSAGKPIVTMMNLAAHNQEIGHSDDPAVRTTLSADWPGYFERRLESLTGGGLGMFLVADNGSEEDPHTVPEVSKDAGPDCPRGCFEQARATGEAFADAVHAELPRAQQLRDGSVRVRSKKFCVPLENNLFRAAVAAGLFGTRQTYACSADQMVPSGDGGQQLKTEVAVADVGPDLQFVANPGEAFPALMLGSPFGAEETPCPGGGTDTSDRTNPPVPTWRATAAYRFQAGLANDMIGYEIPGWAFIGQTGNFTSTCDSGNDDVDANGRQHKLESEGVGPTASNAVANELSKLIGTDPLASIVHGRFVLADGTLSRRAVGAVGISFERKLYALAGVTGFGSRALDGSARMMDYDGGEQPGEGDISTRGMVLFGCDGAVARRIYLDVFAVLPPAPKLPAARRGDVQVGCGAGPAGGGGPGNGPAGAGGGPPQPNAPGVVPAGCKDKRAPRSRVTRARLTRRGAVVRGRSADRGCAGLSAVLVSISKPRAGRCRFVRSNGRLSGRRSCRRPELLRARGVHSWRLTLTARLPRGRYRVLARAVDRRGNKERPAGRALKRARVR